MKTPPPPADLPAETGRFIVLFRAGVKRERGQAGCGRPPSLARPPVLVAALVRPFLLLGRARLVLVLLLALVLVAGAAQGGHGQDRAQERPQDSFHLFQAPRLPARTAFSRRALPQSGGA